MDALLDRYKALVDLLRVGRLEGVGLPATPGYPTRLLRSVWAHKDFSFDAANGNICEINYQSEDQYDRLTRRWTGVVLERSAKEMFHVQPTEHDGLPRSAAAPTALGRAKTTIKAVKECRSWLTAEMQASPDRKSGSKEDWWNRANQKWPNTLSKYGFNRAWSDAVALSDAAAWSASGAPKRTKS